MRARQRTRTPSAIGQDTRQRLIEVAAKHFAAHGYQGVSLRAIQRELGMSPATVHYYFGSKEALYRGVVDAYIHDIQEERIRRLEAQGRSELDRALSLSVALMAVVGWIRAVALLND